MIPEWLPNSIIYQIYPQSFQDSNGDGIGDFRGLTRRLDYLEKLGVNTLWLTPFFDSPFGDAGYDVRSYTKIADRYGTFRDFQVFMEAAKDRQMHVILDLVAGHTSIEHEWFIESAKGPDNFHSNRYIWKNRDFDPAVGPTTDNYVHNFFPFQPALNFGYANPTEPWQDSVDAEGPRRNRRALREIMVYWINLGISGFRIDMASSLVKNDPGFVETSRLWQDLHNWLIYEYPNIALIAEWSNPAEAIPAGYHLDFMMHFNQDIYRSLFFNGAGTLPNHVAPYFDAAGQGDVRPFMEEYAHQLKEIDGLGYISLPTANHDFQRLRVGPRSWEGLRPAWTFLMTQKGIPTIYYGDEIGMRYVEETPTKEGSLQIGLESAGLVGAVGERAGSRTPMQWNGTRNAGFSTAEPDHLYLPLDPDPERPTVSSQNLEPNSFLKFVRKLIAIRKETPALGVHGSYDYVNLNGNPYPLTIMRANEEETYLIVINPTDKSQKSKVNVPPEIHNAKLVLGEGVTPLCEYKHIWVKADPFSQAIYKLT